LAPAARQKLQFVTKGETGVCRTGRGVAGRGFVKQKFQDKGSVGQEERLQEKESTGQEAGLQERRSGRRQWVSRTAEGVAGQGVSMTAGGL
jgi:hypothetical protein